MPVGDLLGHATRRMLRENGSVLSGVRTAWAEAAGPGTVNHAYPTRRSRAGVVTISCADAVWAHELNMRQDELMERLAGVLGGADVVSGLRFVVADHAIPRPAPVREPRPPRPPPDEATMKRAAAAAAMISDPELRDLLTRAAARSMQDETTP